MSLAPVGSHSSALHWLCLAEMSQCLGIYGSSLGRINKYHNKVLLILSMGLELKVVLTGKEDTNA